MTLLPECLDDWIGEDNSVHVIEAFVEALDHCGISQAHPYCIGMEIRSTSRREQCI
jgi:CDGSH-type Zn-finger protein